MRLHVAFLILLASCAGPQEEMPGRSHLTSNPVFNKYIEQFEAYRGMRDQQNIAVAFESLEAPDVGKCIKYEDGRRVIKIDPYFWDNSVEIVKSALMFHELGHCELDLEHNKGKYSDGCPVSIMNDYIPVEDCLMYYWDDYINQLFNR